MIGQVTPGCTDNTAVNYDPGATEDDGSCVFNPCFNQTACNFDPEVVWNEGPCIFAEEGYDCDGNCLVADNNNNGICDSLEVEGCTNPDALNYNPEANVNDGSCLVCPPLFSFGCTNPSACNFDPYAVYNNGSCQFGSCGGCTYELANNYDPEATEDDGSCEFPCSGNVNQNVFDWDDDNTVTIADFLAILSVFGDVDLDDDGIWDSQDACTDLEACNYANEPSEPCAYLDVLGECGGGCEGDGDGDGICDDVDDCVGVVDECGVCNGPGPTEVVIEDITILYDSVYLPQLEEWYVYEFGADTTFSFECSPLFACGDPVSYQGYDYATVLIGEQCWFAENLRSENYENGDAIPSNLSNSEWENTLSGAVAVYGEHVGCYNYSPDIDACDPAQSLNEFGRLYNWYAVDDARGICPSGWHIPTDGEWMTLEMALGMSESEANDTGYRGTDQGTQMKTDYGWSGGGNGTNSSGFSGLPGGFRGLNGGFFYEAGNRGYWWSSSPNGALPWGRYLGDYYEDVGRYASNPRLGFSVRCILDAE